MVKRRNRVILAVVFGLAAWTIDALFDYFIFYEGTFLELFITDVPSHEIYIRISFILLFFVFTFIIGHSLGKLRKANDRIEHLNSLLKSIRNVNQIIVQGDSLSEIIQKSCESLSNARSYLNTTVGLLDEKTGKIRPVGKAGRYAFEKDWYITPEGEGNAPECIKNTLKKRQTKRIDSKDCDSSCVFKNKVPPHQSMILPLKRKNKLNGVLHIAFEENVKLDDEEKAMLKEVATDLAFAREKKKTEKELRKSEQKYRRLFNSIRDAILVADTNRNIVDCNKAFNDLFEYDLEDIKGKKTKYLYKDPEEFEKMGEKIKENIGNPKFFYTVEYEKKSGESFPGETSVFYLKDEEANITGFIGVIRDITERKKAEKKQKELEKQLAQSQKMEAVGNLAGGIAHDFNNMLQVILSGTEFAFQKIEDGVDAEEEIAYIQNAAEQASELTKKLLTFSRREVMELEEINLNNIIKNCLGMLKKIIPENININFIPGKALGTV